MKNKKKYYHKKKATLNQEEYNQAIDKIIYYVELLELMGEEKKIARYKAAVEVIDF